MPISNTGSSSVLEILGYNPLLDLQCEFKYVLCWLLYYYSFNSAATIRGKVLLLVGIQVQHCSSGWPRERENAHNPLSSVSSVKLIII